MLGNRRASKVSSSSSRESDHHHEIGIAIMSVIGFVVMGYDKNQAINGGWRVKNDYNYFLAIIFGAPGVLLAMVAFRHKIRQWPYWVVIVIGLVIDVSLFITFLVH